MNKGLTFQVWRSFSTHY